MTQFYTGLYFSIILYLLYSPAALLWYSFGEMLSEKHLRSTIFRVDDQIQRKICLKIFLRTWNAFFKFPWMIKFWGFTMRMNYIDIYPTAFTACDGDYSIRENQIDRRCDVNSESIFPKNLAEFESNWGNCDGFRIPWSGDRVRKILNTLPAVDNSRFKPIFRIDDTLAVDLIYRGASRMAFSISTRDVAK